MTDRDRRPVQRVSGRPEHFPAYSYRADAAVPSFPDDKALIVFDGVCVLCSGFAKFILKHDKHAAFRLTTAQSPLGQALYRHYGLDTEAFESNLVLVEGRVHTKLDTVAAVGHALGGPWRALALVGLLPRSLGTGSTTAWRRAAMPCLAARRVACFRLRNGATASSTERPASCPPRAISRPCRSSEVVMPSKPDVQALLFDVFGTVVDWRTSIIDDMTRFGAEKGIKADWAAFADDWRGLYQPAMDDVRTGRRPWTILDVLHRESLDKLAGRYGLDKLSEADKDHVNKVWHRLNPWPDSVPGLWRLKSRYIIGTLSNGNVGLLTRMAKHGGLPWDVILGAEPARAYKPLAQAYIGSAELLNLAPSQVMLVAAHNGDLAAAASAGLRTAFVARPTEYGAKQDRDFKAERDWDVVADSFRGVATAMGC